MLQVSLKQEKCQEALENIRKLKETLQQRKLEKAEHKIKEEEVRVATLLIVEIWDMDIVAWWYET